MQIIEVLEVLGKNDWIVKLQLFYYSNDGHIPLHYKRSAVLFILLSLESQN